MNNHTAAAKKANASVGRQGEDTAVEFLRRKGYKILERNYKTPSGEIDIIARDNDTLCFIEVKTRNSRACGFPSEAVHGYKQNKIAQSALRYLKGKNLLEHNARFDIVSVMCSDAAPVVELVKNAFELSSMYT